MRSPRRCSRWRRRDDRPPPRQARGHRGQRGDRRRERRRVPGGRHAVGAPAGGRRGDGAGAHRRSRGRAAAVRIRGRGGARAVRAAARRVRGRPEGRACDRLGLHARRAAQGDRARGREALPGDPRHRVEDRAARGARAEGETACLRGGGAGGDRRPPRPRRARRARLVAARRRAGPCRRRRVAAGRGAGARRAAAGGMTQFLAPVPAEAEEDLERSLRPRRLDDFVGQERVKEQLAIALEAAKARGEALDHLLLAGPPGLGKTSLAQIVRNELGVGIRQVAGPALERKGDMAAILTSLEPRDVLFIDEIHRINRSIEEILYPALEDFRLDIVVGQGPAARTLTLDLPPFTLIGATTRTGLLTTPLRDRFGLTFRLDLYDAVELARIVRRSAGILGVQVDDDAAELVAARSRGTPRVANRILRRVRDVAEVRHQGVVTTAIAEEALALLEVDAVGLERFDRDLLRCVIDKFGGGPVGLSPLAVSLGEEAETIEDVYEPYLLQLGFLQRTPRGRVVTDLGRSPLGALSDASTLF